MSSLLKTAKKLLPKTSKRKKKEKERAAHEAGWRVDGDAADAEPPAPPAPPAPAPASPPAEPLEAAYAAADFGSPVAARERKGGADEAEARGAEEVKEPARSSPSGAPARSSPSANSARAAAWGEEVPDEVPERVWEAYRGWRIARSRVGGGGLFG